MRLPGSVGQHINELAGCLPTGYTNRDILAELERGNPVRDVPDSLGFIYRPSVQPYLMSLFKYVPCIELQKLTIPILIVQGH